MDLKYQQRVNSNERTNPRLGHSRFVFLRRLLTELLKIVKSYESHIRGATIVDMGCGIKPYKKHFDTFNPQYIGVDLPGNNLADYFIDLKTNRSPLGNDVGDVVLSLNVLEHVENPRGYLEECNRILKDGGIMILGTHGHWKYHPDPIDMRRWTSMGLKWEISQHGFDVLYIKGIFDLVTASLQLFQDGMLNNFPNKKFWTIPFVFFWQRIIGFSNWFFNKSKSARDYTDLDAAYFYVVAKKNSK